MQHKMKRYHYGLCLRCRKLDRGKTVVSDHLDDASILHLFGVLITVFTVVTTL